MAFLTSISSKTEFISSFKILSRGSNILPEASDLTTVRFPCDGFEKSRGNEGVQCFPERRATNAELFDQFPLGRKAVTRFELTLNDEGFYLIDNLI